METTTSLFPIYLRHACNLYEVQFIVVTDRAGAVLFYSVYFIVFGGINVQGIWVQHKFGDNKVHHILSYRNSNGKVVYLKN